MMDQKNKPTKKTPIQNPKKLKIKKNQAMNNTIVMKISKMLMIRCADGSKRLSRTKLIF